MIVHLYTSLASINPSVKNRYKPEQHALAIRSSALNISYTPSAPNSCLGATLNLGATLQGHLQWVTTLYNLFSELGLSGLLKIIRDLCTQHPSGNRGGKGAGGRAEDQRERVASRSHYEWDLSVYRTCNYVEGACKSKQAAYDGREKGAEEREGVRERGRCVE